MIAMFGLAISGDNLIGIVMAVLGAAYLITVLLKPERF